MLWRHISIESVLSQILFFLQVNLCLFSRSIVDDDLNSLLDWKWVKSTSLSRSKSISSSFRSIVDNDPNRRLHRKWAESPSLSFLDKWSRMITRLSLRKLSAIHFSVSKWVFSFSRSILGGELKTLLDRNWLESSSLSFFKSISSFSDQPSTMIWIVCSIESELSQLLFFLQANLCLFSRSIVEEDQNIVFDRKWLELTSLSADGISIFSRFIVDNDSNSLLDWERVKSTSFAPRKLITAFVGSIIDHDPNTLIDWWWVNFASLSWIEFFHFLDLSSTMIGTRGGKRTPDVQNHKKVSWGCEGWV